MQPLSQRDPRWATKKIGNSWLTIGRYGCTLTCVSMITGLNPDNVAKRLKFTSKGLLEWASVSVLGLKFLERVRGFYPDRINKALADGKHVLLEVDHTHWVLAYEKSPWFWKKNYRIIDPWFGDYAISTRYKKITGFSILSDI